MIVGTVVPWLAFLVATTSTSGISDSVVHVGTILVAPVYLVAVGLPSLAVVVAGRHRRLRAAGVVVMTSPSPPG